MRFLLLFTLGFRLAVPLLAQEPTKNFIEIKLKSNQYKAVAYLEEPGRTDGGSTLLFSGKDFLAFWDVNSDFTDYTETAVVPSAAAKGIPPGSTLLPMAHHAVGAKLVVLAQYQHPTSNPNLPIIVFRIVYDRTARSVQVDKAITLSANTTLHASLSLGSEVWLMTSHATRDDLVIHRFSGENTSDSTLLDMKALAAVAEQPIEPKETAVGQALKRAKGFSVFYPDTDRDLSNGLESNKLYVAKDKISILLLVENQVAPKQRFLLEIDRSSLQHTLSTSEETFSYANAELYGSFILTLRLTEEKTELKWWDKATFKELKTYTILPSDSKIDFVNLPPVQKGTNSALTVLQNPSQVVKRLAKGSDGGIVATLQKDGKLKVTFGSFTEIIRSYNFNHQFMFNPAFNPAFRPPVPTSFGRFGPSDFSFSYCVSDYPSGPVIIGDAIRASVNSKVITLKGLFDPATGEHLSGDIELNPYDKAFQKLDASLSSVETFCFYTDPANLYLVYYSKSSKGIHRIAYPK